MGRPILIGCAKKATTTTTTEPFICDYRKDFKVAPVKFCVWVSFAEIYNSTINDLLEPSGKGRGRTSLKLGKDKNGKSLIKGGFSPFLLKKKQAFFSVKTFV